MLGYGFKQLPTDRGLVFGGTFALGAALSLVLAPLFGGYARRHLVRQFSTFFVSAAWLLGLIHVGFPALGGLMSVEFSLASACLPAPAWPMVAAVAAVAVGTDWRHCGA